MLFAAVLLAAELTAQPVFDLKPRLPAIPQKTIDAAIAVKLMRFNRGDPGTSRFRCRFVPSYLPK
ncbi:MAG: hypothetical protein WCO56_25130 [Verrucomicrobiota bacterium]